MNIPLLHQHNFQPSCSACALAGICLPVAVESVQIDAIEAVIEKRRSLRRGEHLFHGGDKFTSLFAVRSGSIKSYKVTSDGEEQVVGFHLPGEIFGLDGIGEAQHGTSASAMESSTLCEIPFDKITDLARQLPGIQAHLLQLMSKEIAEDQHLLVLLSKRTADERVAAFLLSLSARYRRRRLSPTRFRLPMSRADLGNYLGLVIETVSRVLGRLQQQGLIQLQQREIEILDLDKLHDAASVPRPNVDVSRG